MDAPTGEHSTDIASASGAMDFTSCPADIFALELEQPEVGRVLRFDSLSKVLSAGIRIGFLCGPEPLMTLIDMHVRPRGVCSHPFPHE